MPTILIGVADVSYTAKLLTLPIVADSIDFAPSITGGVIVTGGGGTDPAKDKTFSCAFNNQGVIEFGFSIYGLSLNNTHTSDSIDFAPSITGSVPQGNVIDESISFAPEISAYCYTTGLQSNFVAWSKIGQATTLIDRTNQAGYAPMEWPGWAYAVKQLEDMLVIYGAEGITLMYPVNEPVPTFGFRTISQVGLFSSRAFAGTDFIHYFMVENGDLWRLTKKGPENLGFKEFLSTLSEPILSYDDHEARLHIADGTTGYTFDHGLGGGYATLSGISDSLVASPSALAGIPVNIMTDTIDLGHRGQKLVTMVEVGTDTTESLFVAVDYRYNKAEAWRTSDWVLVNYEGMAFVNVSGIEFRFRIKQTTYDELRIDYLNVRHKRTDKRYIRGPLYEQPDQGSQT